MTHPLRWISMLLLSTTIVAPSQSDSLEDRISELDRLIAETRSQLDAPEDDFAELRAVRDALASEVVETGVALELARREQQEILQEVRTLSKKGAAPFDEATEMRRAHELLTLQARELPTFERRVPQPDSDWDQLITLFEAMHRQGTRVGLETIAIYTAEGREVACQVLNVGLLMYAYRNPESDSFGISVASPRETRGYRFTEQIDPSTIASLERAFSGIARQDETVVVPFDPSGSIASETDLVEEAWIDRLRAGGPLMIVLLGLALCAVGIAIERFVRLLGAAPRNIDTLLDTVLSQCRHGRYSEATKRCDAGGVPGRVMSAAISRRSQGAAAMEDAIQERLLHEVPRLEQFLGGLGVLAVVAPLVGLLGTVTGIIQTFAVIRELTTNDPQLLSGGISQALLTTAGGLAIAIPALLVQGCFRGRVDRIVSDTERCAASVLVELGKENVAEEAP